MKSNRKTNKQRKAEGLVKPVRVNTPAPRREPDLRKEASRKACRDFRGAY